MRTPAGTVITSGLNTASASGPMPSSTLMTRPLAILISTALLRRSEVIVAARVTWAGGGSDAAGSGLTRVPSLASGTMLVGANVAPALAQATAPASARPSALPRPLIDEPARNAMPVGNPRAPVAAGGLRMSMVPIAQLLASCSPLFRRAKRIGATHLSADF